MKKIGILSDTHGYWDEKYLHYFEPCDEIWHAGDIGSVEVADRLAAFRPFRAVCGNCDGGDLRLMYRELNRFKCEDVDVLIKHIGGYPGNYDFSVRSTLFANPPQLFADLADDITVMGKGAGSLETASAMLTDLINIIKNK